MILLTGQEPPEGFDASPSAALVRRLGGERIGGHDIGTLVLPWDAGDAGEAVVDAIDERGPAAVVATGFDPGSPAVTVERLGLSIGDWLAVADDRREVADVDHPVGYFATIPSDAIVGRLRERGIPARLSTAAGTQFCHSLLFEALGHVDRENLSIPAGFLHLPCLPAQSVRAASDGVGTDFLPSVAAETQLEGLVVALDCTVGAL